ncbi:recombinase family protein [Amycolatopsis cihanbeyliensis]|nr:recombinase family protein [Amycolatopsis cihanbeyliensis]
MQAAADTSKPLRALIAVRLSRLSDDTTSPERQLKECEQHVAAKGWTVAGVAEDLDVSARTTAPFDRAELGKWLRNRAHEFDVIVFWRLDRIVRSVADLNDLLSWGKQHGKHFASATEEHFDTSTPIGYIIAILIAWVAEMESQATSERTTSMHADFIDDGRYRGGTPSFGYRPVLIEETCWVCADAGIGCSHVGQKRLEHDPVMAPLAQQIVSRIVDDGERPMSITKDLSERGVLTPHDHHRVNLGREPKGSAWQVGILVALLRNPALMGYQVRRHVIGVDQDGQKVYGPHEIVRDENDKPILRAQPIIDPVMFDRLQRKLDEMNKRRGPNQNTRAVLIGVIKCAVCGTNMYLNSGRRNSYYRCRSVSTGRPCGNKSVRQDDAENALIEQLLNDFGDMERKEKIYDPGEDHASELEQVRVTLDDLTNLLTKPAYREGTRQRERLERQIEKLATREAELEAIPSRPSRYRVVGTGETFREYWNSLDQQEKNLYLRDHEVTMTVRGGKAPVWDIDFADLPAILGSIDPDLDADTFLQEQDEQARSYRESLVS